ncbi:MULTISPECIES: hypothetical protein [Frankia]|uniref:J domain-containing protein n=1 Tax=Frankia alni (strain DSM 45986 / CECT 9034 / ACN14a) TaxID=326424 RepID=Q0RCD0_FRAAA|nr:MULTISPECIES: hypothetical protein [Frankia]CAJ64896.1 hypothetical protein; putative GTP-binding protein [Frankia alni ACN14a]
MGLVTVTPQEAGDAARPDSRADADAARRRAEIRAFVRTHHPDRGGDPDAFAEGLRALRAGQPTTGRSTTGRWAEADSGPTAYRRRTVAEHLAGWVAERGRGWRGAARRQVVTARWGRRLGVRWVHRRQAQRAQRGPRVR